ncbi:unnamed protein product [Thelazia callipaeda]|uniref:VHS domain-containing protein n=1 Tax=Thelazia callipaeda TaxID=103827 RepID=A0A0N5DB20_THECL|nr:unnamed protein product [Thelazia callipaeda]
MNEPIFINRLFKQLMELHTDRAVILDTILYLCWENIHFTKIFLYNFSFESSCTSNEVKNATAVIESVIEINDSVRKERQRLALLGFDSGSQKYKGLVPTMITQKEIHSWKVYHLIRTLINVASNNPGIVEVLAENEQIRNKLHKMKEWLKSQLAIQSAKRNMYDYSKRHDDLDTSAETERGDNIVEIYEQFCEFLSKLCNPFVSNFKCSSSNDHSLGKDTYLDDMSRTVPEVSSEGCSSCVFGGNSRIAGPSFDDKNHDGTFSAREPSKITPKKTAPLIPKEILEDLTLGTSISLSEKLLANIGLPPPPSYSESESTNVSHSALHPQQPLSPHWNISSSTDGIRSGDSSADSTSTGIEVEDAPPPYEQF